MLKLLKQNKKDEILVSGIFINKEECFKGKHWFVWVFFSVLCVCTQAIFTALIIKELMASSLKFRIQAGSHPNEYE